MTVCIAALSSDGKALVAAADRMLTVGGLNLEFEHERPKIETIVGNHLVLSAGDALLSSEIVGAAQDILRNQKTADVTTAGQILADQYVALRRRRLEAQLLVPLGYTLPSFQNDGNRQLGPQVFINLIQQVQQFNIGVELLLAGFSSDGHARIAHVTHPGIIHWFDRVGYHAIGSGGMHALLLLSMSGHSRKCTVEEALFDVYSAKRNSEVAPGVGEDTDIVVISQRGVVHVAASIIEELERVYDGHGSPPKPELKQIKELYDAAPSVANN